MLALTALVVHTAILTGTPPIHRPATTDTSKTTANVTVRFDDRHHRVAVTVGPFDVPPSMGMGGMDMMMMMHRAESLVGAFDWPATRDLHGISLEVLDARGAPLPRRLLHHTYMVNVDRRQLVYPIMERTFSFGEETSDFDVPATIGMPMMKGQRMGIVIMWNNETGHEVDGVYVRYTFLLNPRRQTPPPMQVMPFFVDSHMVIGALDTFSVAPGGRTLTRDFSVPISGRLIAASGHLHDHALRMRLVDVRNGHVLVTVKARRDSLGHTLAVSRELPGLWGRGPHLIAGRQYRLVVQYDNPTPDTLFGAMGMMGGLFVPDHPADWPAVNRSDPAWQSDVGGMVGAEQLLVAPRVVTAHAAPAKISRRGGFAPAAGGRP